MHIPEEHFKNSTAHRSIGSDESRGIISCGFLHKKQQSSSDRNILFDYYGSLMLLSGEGTHVDCDGRTYALTPGCFIQRLPGKLHSTYVKPDGKWLEFFICFGKGVFDSLVELNVLNTQQDVLYPGVNTALLNEFVGFMAALRAAPEEELPLMLTEAQRIILTIYRMHRRNSIKHENMELINQACRLLGDPFNRVSAKEAAEQLGVGYEKFRKLFSTQMGASPGTYAIQSRINTAKSMLIESEQSVKSIALELGFPDAFSFSRQFSKSVGMPPSAYKKMY